MQRFNRPLPQRQRQQAGFSLVELLITLVVGGALGMALMQVLLAENGASQRLGRLLRERQLSQRALELMRQELQQAEWVRTAADPPAAAAADPWESSCGLAGRTPVLQLGTQAGVITYTVGRAPSSIWRGTVLMRCGPAYGLAGELGHGTPQNRVLLDGLVNAEAGLTVVAPPGPRPGLLTLSLQRQLAVDEILAQEIVAPAPASRGIGPFT